MKIQQAIEAAIQQQDLDKDAMVEVMRTIMTGDATPAQIAGFLVALRMKGETVDEIAAAAIVMRELATAVDVEGEHLVDIVGTCLLYTSPSPRDGLLSRMPSSA